MARRPKIQVRSKPERRLSKTPASVFLGGEYRVVSISGRNDPQLARALNWYNYNCEQSQGKEWLLKYMELREFDKAQITGIRKIPDWAVSGTACWVSKMYINGTVLADENHDWISKQINTSLEKYSARAEEKAANDALKPVVDLAARTQNKIEQLFCLAEEWVDQFMETGKQTSMYDFLKGNSASPAAANFIRAKYEKISEDFQNSDAQLKEAYGKKLKMWTEFYAMIVTDCDRYVGNRKAMKVRKPRTVKVKPAAKIVEKVKYQKEDKTLKLASANPESLIGAQQVWTYNTKYKQLAVYYAIDSGKGMGVHGSGLTGFDETASISKGLRKPEITLNTVLTSTKHQLKRVMESLTTTSRVGNGRFNENTIILRVIQ